MVIRRTIEHMRERPRDERVAFAGMIAIAVVVVLFLGWAIFFFYRISNLDTASPLPADTSTAENIGTAQ